MKLTIGILGRSLVALGLLAASAIAAGAAPGQTVYQIQQIVRLGDSVGNIAIDSHIDIGTLNDRGQISFLTQNTDGAEVLVQYANNRLTPIVNGGADAPGWQWGTNNGIEAPVNMNQLGNVVFATDLTVGGVTEVRTFLWDYQTRTIATVAKQGMPAVRNLTLETGGDATPAINNHNDIALVAAVKNAVGQAEDGIFLRRADGTLHEVALLDGNCHVRLRPRSGRLAPRPRGGCSGQPLRSGLLPQPGAEVYAGALTLTANITPR